ncbi:MAG: UvrD-helicase domain-containing protein [Spirochaetales bacterium]|nr:UvrD-helicase domain-containing protein [Spirochaetales bacterium]
MALQLQKELNPEQADAAATISGPVLIIAGAGSGKTRMITYRIAYMLEQGISQSEILALTFTNKAASEMAERIRLVTGKPMNKLTASTFHSFGLSVLKRNGSYLGYSKGFSVYDQSDKMGMLKSSLVELRIDPKSEDLYALSELISSIKTGRLQFSADTSEYKPLFKEYNSHLKLYNAVDFDDLIMQPIALFQQFPEILELYRKKYKYILVDEFQDTSIQQYQLVKMLSCNHRNLCVVGDDDQSIYSWRGADFRNITNFEKDYPECREIKLEQNYRSTGTIIQAANTLIKNNKNRKKKRLWTGDEKSGIIALSHPEDESEEAEFIADKIKEVMIKHRLRYDNFGVLLRTNNLLTAIEHAFLSSNIPYKVSGGQSFFQRKEIKDIIAYLRIMANLDDEMSLLRIINTPKRGIGKTTLQFFRKLSDQKNCSLFSAITASVHAADTGIRESIRRNSSELIDFINSYREQLFSRKKLSTVLTSMLTDISYKNHIISEHPDNDQLAQWKMKNVDLFISILDRWERNPDKKGDSLYDFLGSISLVGKTEPDQEAGKVNLMTVHASKGLEFHTVFLAGVEDHIIPHKRSLEENPDNIEEERRLFYVAITRAKNNLYMTSCRTRKYMREVIETIPSRFLEELPSDLIEQPGEDTVADVESAANYFDQMRQRLKAGVP